MRLTTQRPKIKVTCNSIKLPTCNYYMQSQCSTEFYCIPKNISNPFFILSNHWPIELVTTTTIEKNNSVATQSIKQNKYYLIRKNSIFEATKKPKGLRKRFFLFVFVSLRSVSIWWLLWFGVGVVVIVDWIVSKFSDMLPFGIIVPLIQMNES